MLPKLNFPDTDFKTRSWEGKLQIFDRIRKKYVVCTPEEWVRQHMIAFLSTHRGWPESLMGTEQMVPGNQLKNRTDIVLSNNQGKKMMIVECKAPAVKITQQVFDQAARYNNILKVPYLCVTNGINHFFCRIDHQNQSFEYLKDCPFYTEIQL